MRNAQEAAMELLAELLNSKRFVAAVVAAIVAAGGKLELNWSTETVALVVAPFVAYIGSQAVADHGKEKARIENGILTKRELKKRARHPDSRVPASALEKLP